MIRQVRLSRSISAIEIGRRKSLLSSGTRICKNCPACIWLTIWPFRSMEKILGAISTCSSSSICSSIILPNLFLQLSLTMTTSLSTRKNLATARFRKKQGSQLPLISFFLPCSLAGLD